MSSVRIEFSDITPYGIPHVQARDLSQEYVRVCRVLTSRHDGLAGGWPSRRSRDFPVHFVIWRSMMASVLNAGTENSVLLPRFSTSISWAPSAAPLAANLTGW